MREPVEWPTRDPLSHRTTATPDRTAVVAVESDREWTYAEFDRVVDRVAGRLRDAVPEDGSDARVGTLIDTRVAFVAVLHATLRLGAQLVPLNVRLADPELGDRLDRVALDLLVCEHDTVERAASIASCKTMSVDGNAGAGVESLEWDAEGHDPSKAPARWGREETALVMFTSGTTGQPKGVRLTLGNLVASATASAFRLGVNRSDRWLCCLPTYHMGGLAPLVRCPLYGTTVLVQRGFDANSTARAMASEGATGVSLVPTQLTRLLDDDWRPPETLETVLLGGAPAPRSLVERARDAGVPVYPTYGLTETASQVATATPADARRHPESVGQPLLFSEVTIVDEAGTPVDTGETGELVVSGPTVTAGYLDDERTREAFGEFGLHTRDVGYRGEDGRLWIVGRADDTIVTGGQNVHPREVSDALTAHPQVEQAVVVGISDEEWGERIGALVVPTDGPLDSEIVLEYLRKHLADYKIPKTLAVESSLPRTQSGTVDRGAVRDRLRRE